MLSPYNSTLQNLRKSFQVPRFSNEPPVSSESTIRFWNPREKKKDNNECSICNKSFSTKGNLKNHINSIHWKMLPFKCQFRDCNKSFPNQSRLQVHQRVHAGIKPFICHTCTKQFNEKGNLKTHLFFHWNSRPFTCVECKKSYKTKGHLKDHTKIFHWKIKNYICEICCKRFGRSSTLKAHKRMHSGEKNFICLWNNCGKSFTEKGNMLIHYARHFGKLKQKSNINLCNLINNNNSSNINLSWDPIMSNSGGSDISERRHSRF